MGQACTSESSNSSKSKSKRSKQGGTIEKKQQRRDGSSSKTDMTSDSTVMAGGEQDSSRQSSEGGRGSDSEGEGSGSSRSTAEKSKKKKKRAKDCVLAPRRDQYTMEAYRTILAEERAIGVFDEIDHDREMRLARQISVVSRSAPPTPTSPQSPAGNFFGTLSPEEKGIHHSPDKDGGGAGSNSVNVHQHLQMMMLSATAVDSASEDVPTDNDEATEVTEEVPAATGYPDELITYVGEKKGGAEPPQLGEETPLSHVSSFVEEPRSPTRSILRGKGSSRQRPQRQQHDGGAVGTATPSLNSSCSGTPNVHSRSTSPRNMPIYAPLPHHRGSLTPSLSSYSSQQGGGVVALDPPENSGSFSLFSPPTPPSGLKASSCSAPTAEGAALLLRLKALQPPQLSSFSRSGSSQKLDAVGGEDLPHTPQLRSEEDDGGGSRYSQSSTDYHVAGTSSALAGREVQQGLEPTLILGNSSSCHPALPTTTPAPMADYWTPATPPSASRIGGEEGNNNGSLVGGVMGGGTLDVSQRSNSSATTTRSVEALSTTREGVISRGVSFHSTVVSEGSGLAKRRPIEVKPSKLRD